MESSQFKQNPGKVGKWPSVQEGWKPPTRIDLKGLPAQPGKRRWLYRSGLYNLFLQRLIVSPGEDTIFCEVNESEAMVCPEEILPDLGRQKRKWVSDMK